ncbi:2Fe-2S iron-sulfur cluster-binding protein [Streptomyces sp. XM4193]|uniref:2Fe-2S iron-sulfur cluster-binding protein n=1 Tax=Streptomyces sp. XM4193 TaxID=2929782 RepID=UPI001FF7FF30|nr:2Fe-2S iron-sulfur cluster-binding protein [Streptomyces sp. XM4193]MCK1794540.1 2Fe-2S iron-sulfur cluster-binding protein [Streptomyces sp. XM4193]
MFHPLRVAEVEPLTDDAVRITFEVPPELWETFRHRPGQHLNLRHRDTDGREVRRSYSICAPATAAPAAPLLRIGVRRVEDGVFSTYALKELAAGDTVEAMPPTGRFVLEPRPGHFAAVVGGSGITPVLSIAATLLEREPGARFCLVRSDRTVASTMFLEETAELKDRYPDRFQLVNALSREEQHAGLPSGRLDEERLAALLPALLPVPEVDGWFLCGPLGLIRSTEAVLSALGVARERVHQEVFHAGEETVAAPPGGWTAPGGATVTATLDGRSGSWPVRDGETVLETVLRNRADAPYACKGGVCGTCRVRVTAGEVRMERNYALEEEELASGYALACQSHPATAAVSVDFDA